jgi:hypothetical protein
VVITANELVQKRLGNVNDGSEKESEIQNRDVTVFFDAARLPD